MLTLGNLSPKEGAVKEKKRLGRGPGSGHGKTAGRGHKGAKSRSGYKSKPGFEGGQMPLQRRLPKRGFYNKFSIEYTIISLSQLEKLTEVAEINNDTLREAGLLKPGQLSKVLANGEITRAVTVCVDKISRQAQQKIEQAGGTVTLVSALEE
ncbi:50S ribosomal protein L15 [Desulfopila inferna]|uniref:50S ribosomal protein L15 n=1 Tax=Desulfopila inferna TaxID=468528 RepID=UPI001965C3EE|nr:50S ribosomal protein L15 [Desulfopila inferna]MBM9605416.1 50S ribosomal protein L15 [Desulfopila inferna]